MRTFKRFLSLALVLMMAISMMSAAVFAEESEATSECKIGDTYHDTLDAAVSTAEDGATITILKSISFDGRTKVTVGGKSLTFEGVSQDVTITNFQLKDTAEVEKLVFKNLTFDGTWAMDLSHTKDLTVDGCIFTTTENTAIRARSAIERATITGNTFGSVDTPIGKEFVRFMDFTTAGATFTLTGNTVYTTEYAFYFRQLDNVNYNVVIEKNNFCQGTPVYLMVKNGNGSDCDATVLAATDNYFGEGDGKVAFAESNVGQYVTIESGKTLTGSIQIVEPTPTVLPEFYGTNLTLGTVNDISFFIEKSKLAGYDAAGLTAHFVMDRQSEDRGETAEVTSYDDDFYRVRFTNVAAAEMCDEITVVLKNAQGNAVTAEKTITMGQAIRNLYDTTTDENMKELCVAMLNYGAAAQAAFNYNVTDLASQYLPS